MKVSKAFEQAIKTMVDQYAESDSLFRSKLENEKKSITQCCEYICSEVKKIGRQGYADEEILQMAIHYYDEDDIKFDDPGEMTVVTYQRVELTQEEIEQERARAKELVRQKAYDEMVREQRKKNEQKQKEKTVVDNQLSMF